jgi:YbbR domain-containing protein
VIPFFTDHLGVKLLALLLAIVVYAHVYTEQEQEAILRVPLRVTGLPSDLVLLQDPPEEVELAARGSGKQVLKLRVQHPVLLVNLNEVRPGQIQRMLSPLDVALPVGSEVVITDIRAPRLVEFSVDTLVTLDVDVRAISQGRPPEGFVLAAVPAPEPSRVTLRGPSQVVRDVEHVGAGPILLSELSEGRQRLDLPVLTGNQLVTSDPPLVAVEIFLEPLATRTFSLVPVRLEGLGRSSSVRVEPETAEVVLAGPGDELDEVDPADLQVRLDVLDLQPGRYLLAPQVDTGSPLLELAAVRPARFMVEMGAQPRD